MPKEQPISSLIFDLDGTLIDSAPSILLSFQATLENAGIAPAVRLDRRLIGPPLKKTLATIAGSDDELLLDRLGDDFMTQYDERGLFATQSFDGVAELLETLANQDVALHICTNKRIVPTQKIIEHLGWGRYFASVYSLDMKPERYPDKSALLEAQLRECALDATQTAYVGDTAADAVAAKSQALRFYYAAWGYGEVEYESTPSDWIRADSVSSLRHLLLSKLA